MTFEHLKVISAYVAIATPNIWEIIYDTLRPQKLTLLIKKSHDSFQVIRLSMTLDIFQGHQTVSHQISCKQCVRPIQQKVLQSTRKLYTSFRLVPHLITLKDIILEVIFNLVCHFSNLWQAFASRGL